MKKIQELIEAYKEIGVWEEILNVCRNYKISYSGIDIYYDFLQKNICITERAIIKILQRELGFCVATYIVPTENSKYLGHIFIKPETGEKTVIEIPAFTMKEKFRYLVNLLPQNEKGKFYPIKLLPDLIMSDTGENELVIQALIEDAANYNGNGFKKEAKNEVRNNNRYGYIARNVDEDRYSRSRPYSEERRAPNYSHSRYPERGEYRPARPSYRKPYYNSRYQRPYDD